MKFLDRFILVVFSIIMFVLSVITASVIFGWIELENLMPYLESALSTEPTSNIILGVSSASLRAQKSESCCALTYCWVSGSKSI